jgi:subtilisin family serine protease
MNYKKLSASMASLVEEYETVGSAKMMTEPRAVPLAMEAGSESPAVFAYVRCNADAAISQIPGVNMHSNSGTVRTARVSLDGVDQLSQHEEVHLISPAVSMRPLNDIAATATNLPAFRTRTKASGRGVIVGIVDSGIDVGHSAFSGRIHRIWDQTISGPGWGTTKYGTVLSGPTLAVSSDDHGHGTHVAGIAAGDDPHFGGVAPEADIVVVKTNFLNLGIGDGIRYVFDIADRLKKPAVVNLSLGGHHDAHDGSDDLSELINQQSAPGRIIVSAAGNEGGDDIHGATLIPAGQTVEVLFNVPPNSQPGATPFVRLNGWYDKDASCDISIRTSAGDVTPFQSVIFSGPTSTSYTFTTALVRVTTPPPSATPNGDHHFLVELAPGTLSSVVQGGNWRLRIRNNGPSDVRLDVWSIVPEGARDVSFTGLFNSREMKIGSPGAAAEAITVGSFTSRNAWTDSSSAARGVGLTLNTISDFSSPGPLRNGTRKPDVTAPGAMVVSCLSAPSSPPPSNIVSPGFRVNAGTSMACPFITGLIALLLQDNPLLDAALVKSLLQTQSRIPGKAAGAFDNHWGFGLIDAANL